MLVDRNKAVVREARIEAVYQQIAGAHETVMRVRIVVERLNDYLRRADLENRPSYAGADAGED